MNTRLRSYAEAYVAAADPTTDVVKEFDVCAHTISTTKTVRAFLEDISVPIASRREAIETAFPKLSSATTNFLSLLAHDGRIRDLETLQEHVRNAAAAKEGKRFARVTSAVPLEGKDLDRIERALSKKLGTGVQLEEKTDASLIAGFRVVTDGWAYDASLKGKLDRLQHALNSSDV